MTNHECYDCGKIIEPDRALRFFTNEVNPDPEEGYLREACADRRLVAGIYE